MSVTYYAGYLYVTSLFTGSEIWKVSSDGSTAQPYLRVPSVGGSPAGVVADNAGNLYITDGTAILMVPAGGGGPISVHGVSPDIPTGLTIRGTTLYFVDAISGDIMSVPMSGGTPTVVFSAGRYYATYSITTDPAGNIFAQLGDHQHVAGAIVEIPARSETAQILTLPGLALPSPALPYQVVDGMTWANGYIYFEIGNNAGTFYRFADSVAPATPLNLSVERQLTTITGTWTGAAGATSYTCTLLYGFGNLSRFTIQTTSNNCTFTGLDRSTVYGIQVTANFDGYSSPPTSGFAPLAKWSITCVNRKHTKTVTAVNPTCPPGFHVKG